MSRLNLRLSLPEQELQTDLKIALAQYGLDRAALQLFGQSQDGADALADSRDLRRQPGHFLALRWRQVQAIPAGELLGIEPNIVSLLGIDLDDSADGVIVEHVRLRPAGLKGFVLLLHFVQQAIDHGSDERQRADGLPIDFGWRLFRHWLLGDGGQYRIHSR
jgi:hypothetical protein